jgi:hypothetical protein
MPRNRPLPPDPLSRQPVQRTLPLGLKIQPVSVQRTGAAAHQKRLKRLPNPPLLLFRKRPQQRQTKLLRKPPIAKPGQSRQSQK